MTLNELIKEAKENGVDFDTTILCKNEDQMGTDVSDAEFDFSGGQITVANENFNHSDPWWDDEEDDYEETSSTLDDNDWNEKNDPLYGYSEEDEEEERHYEEVDKIEEKVSYEKEARDILNNHKTEIIQVFKKFNIELKCINGRILTVILPKDFDIENVEQKKAILNQLDNCLDDFYFEATRPNTKTREWKLFL
jgi:hypothetical protein